MFEFLQLLFCEYNLQQFESDIDSGYFDECEVKLEAIYGAMNLSLRSLVH
jgi:hypothetical protein